MDPNNLRSMVQMQQAMQQLSGSMPSFPGISASPAPAGGLDFSNLLGSGGTRSGDFGNNGNPGGGMSTPPLSYKRQ